MTRSNDLPSRRAAAASRPASPSGLSRRQIALGVAGVVGVGAAAGLGALALGLRPERDAAPAVAAGAAAWAVPAATPEAMAAQGAAPLGIGGNVGYADYTPRPFADLVIGSRGFGPPDAYEEGSIPRDADGWPTGPSRIVVANADFSDHVIKGRWKGRFESDGQMTVDSIAGGRMSAPRRQGSVVEFDLDVTEPLSLICSFSAGVRNFRLLAPSADGQRMLHDAARDWYARFDCLRAMDWTGTNGSAETTWERRVPAAKLHGRMSWEGLFRFANEVRQAPGSRLRALWICVGHRTDATYWRELARLARTMLDPQLLLYVEYSNECWNFMFPQTQWLDETGRREASTVAGSDLRSRDEWDPWKRLFGRQCALLAQTFVAEFGGLGRVRPVMCGQVVNPQGQLVPALEFMERRHGPVRDYLWALGTAPYPQGEMAEMDRAEDPLKQMEILRRDLGELVAKHIPAWKPIAQRFGVREVCAYEWGPHTHGSGARAAKRLAHLSSAMGELVGDLGRAMQQAGWTNLCYYKVDPSRQSDKTENSLWSVAQTFDADTPKARALLGLQR